MLVSTVKQSKSAMYIYIHMYINASLVAQMVKNLPVMQESLVQFLDWEDPLEKEIATYSSTGLVNPMDRGVWQVTVYGFEKSQIPLQQIPTTTTSD